VRRVVLETEKQSGKEGVLQGMGKRLRAGEQWKAQGVWVVGVARAETW
jgi:hypothetical protein